MARIIIGISSWADKSLVGSSFYPGEIKAPFERLPRYQLAVEFRFGTWLDDTNREKTLRFLREHGIALVCVDEAQVFPPAFRL